MKNDTATTKKLNNLTDDATAVGILLMIITILVNTVNGALLDGGNEVTRLIMFMVVIAYSFLIAFYITEKRNILRK